MTQFPCDIDGVNYATLTEFVHKVSRNFYSPFSSLCTENYRKTLIFQCSFASNGCQSKLVFTKTTDFLENKYFSFNLQESFLIHYNHPLDRHFVEAHRNCYSELIRLGINQNLAFY